MDWKNESSEMRYKRSNGIEINWAQILCEEDKETFKWRVDEYQVNASYLLYMKKYFIIKIKYFSILKVMMLHNGR